MAISSIYTSANLVWFFVEARSLGGVKKTGRRVLIGAMHLDLDLSDVLAPLAVDFEDADGAVLVPQLLFDVTQREHHALGSGAEPPRMEAHPECLSLARE
jgi:hypothetical protein